MRLIHFMTDSDYIGHRVGLLIYKEPGEPVDVVRLHFAITIGKPRPFKIDFGRHTVIARPRYWAGLLWCRWSPYRIMFIRGVERDYS